MQLSERNQVPGTITSIKLGAVMANVVPDVNGLEIVAAITRPSVESLDLKVGDTATAAVTATEVLIGR